MAIKINPANAGKFTATKERTGKSDEELTESKNPLTRKRAIFAQNAKHWKHGGKKKEPVNELCSALDSIIEFKEKQQPSVEEIKGRNSGAVTGAGVGVWAGLGLGAEHGSGASAGEGIRKTMQKVQTYAKEDAAHEARKNAERYIEIEGPHGEVTKLLKGHEAAQSIPIGERLGSIKEHLKRTARELPTKARYATEDALHSTGKWLTRSSLTRSAAIGALAGAGIGRYLGGRAGASLHKAKAENQKKMAATRVHRQATEVAKAHAMAKGIMENLNKQQNLSVVESHLVEFARGDRVRSMFPHVHPNNFKEGKIFGRLSPRSKFIGSSPLKKDAEGWTIGSSLINPNYPKAAEKAERMNRSAERKMSGYIDEFIAANSKHPNSPLSWLGKRTNLSAIQQHLIQFATEAPVERKTRIAKNVALTGAGVAGIAGAGYLAHKGSKLLGEASAQGKSLASELTGEYAPKIHEIINNVKTVSANAAPPAEMYGDVGRFYQGAKGGLHDVTHPGQWGKKIAAGYREGRSIHTPPPLPGTLAHTIGSNARKYIKGFSSELDSIINFEEPEKKRHGVRGTIGALVLPSIAQTGVGVGTMAAITGNPFNDKKGRVADKSIMENLTSEAASHGVGVHESFNPMMPAFGWRHPSGDGYLARSSRLQIEGLTGSRDPIGVAMHPNVRPAFKPGALAHEIGHTQQSKILASGIPHRAGMMLPGAASLYAASTSDEGRAKKAAIAGVLSAAPMMASEVSASVRGTKLLGKAGMKGARRLSPFIGLPSYAAMAAVPYATYKTKKMLGGYKTPEQKSVKMSAVKQHLIQLGIASGLGETWRSMSGMEKGVTIGASAAAGLSSGAAVSRYQKDAKKQGVTPTRMGAAKAAMKGTSGIGLSAIQSHLIQFISINPELLKGVGKAALKWGGIGAGVGAVAGGASAAISDNPNKSVLGGALKGAVTGGALGAAGGAGYKAWRNSGSFTSGVRGLVGDAGATAANGVERQAQTITDRATGVASLTDRQPSVSPSSSGYANAGDAVRAPIDPDKWNNLDPVTRRRATGVANLANDGGTDGESAAAQNAWMRMRNAHGFSVKGHLLTFSDPRGRNSLGEFSGAQEGGPNPAAMAKTYNPRSIGATIAEGAIGGVAGGAAWSGVKSGAKKIKELAKRK